MRSLILAMLAAVSLPGAALSQTQLDRHIFGTGGGWVASGNFVLESTLGQTQAGLAAYGPIIGDLGFWTVPPSAYADVEPSPAAVVFALNGAMPNPFTTVATIRYAVPSPASVALKVYDTRGALVRRLAEGRAEPGWHAAAWNGCDDSGRRLSAGVYFTVFTAPGVRLSRKTVVLN